MHSMRKILKYCAWTVAALLVIAVISRLALAPVSSAAISYWFEQQGIQASIEDISFDLANGELTLSGLQATADGNEVLKLEQAGLSWSWSALFDKHVKLRSIDLDGLEFDVERGPGKRLVFAGIDLEKLSAQQQPAPDGPSEPLDWSLTLQDFTIDRFKHCYRALPRHDYCSEFETFSWDGDISLDLARIDEASFPLMVVGDLKLVKPRIHHNVLDRDLLRFDELAMRQIAVDTLEAISIESIALDALAFLERSGENGQSQITFVKSFEIDQLRIERMTHLDLAEVRVRGHEAILVNLADKGLEINEWLEPMAVEQSKDAKGQAAEPAKPFTFALARLSYQTAKSIRYQDLSLEQPFSADIHSIEVEIKELDSRKPEQQSQLRYSAKYDEYGTIKIEGSGTPLADKLSFDLTGRIEGLDLRSLSGIAAARIGHNIKSGQLEADMVLKAQQNILDSHIDLTLHQFKLAPLSAADKEKVDSSLGFPLSSSLMLLQDKEDRIVLEIPLTGDLLNPDLHPFDSVRQTVVEAITKAVLTFYTPYGLVPLAGGVFDLATALKFEPVIFDKGSSDFDEADSGELDKIISLMEEKPGVHITLCAFTNSADRRDLFPKTSAVEAHEIKLETKQLEKLDKLGEERLRAVKNHLVDNKIDPSRLVLCATEHVEGEGIAGVEISI